MSTIEINKIVAAVLCALLLLLSLRFVVELAAGHPQGGAPAFVAPPARMEADAAPAVPPVAPEAPPMGLAERIAVADLEAGATAFRKCAACHSAEAGARHKIGPNLWGVAGAPKAGQTGFRYSSALTGIGGVWDDAALDSFLADPRGFAPATKMAFPGIADPGQRAAVIAWLRTRMDGPATGE